MPCPHSRPQRPRRRSRGLAGAGRHNLNASRPRPAARLANDAAALEQFRDLLVTKRRNRIGRRTLRRRQSATARASPTALKTKLTLPRRNDEQVIEIARLDLDAEVLLQGRAGADAARLPASPT